MILSLGPDPSDPAADPLIWFSQIQGPPNSPFECGVFTLKIVIPPDYPDVPPKIEFITPILHPNVQNGQICMSLLEQWPRNMLIEHAVFAVI